MLWLYLTEYTGLKKSTGKNPQIHSSFKGQKLGQAWIPQVGQPEVSPRCQAASREHWKARARAQWAPEDKERRKALKGSGILPT